MLPCVPERQHTHCYHSHDYLTSDPRTFFRYSNGVIGLSDGVQHLHHPTVGISSEDIWEGDWSEGTILELVFDRDLLGHGNYRNCVGIFAKRCEGTFG